MSEPHRNLEGPTDPWGHDVHEVINPVDSMRWLLNELGARSLSGMLRRGDQIVFTARLGEEGYLPADQEKDCNGPVTVRAATTTTVAARLALDYLIWGWGGKPRERRERFFPAEAITHALELIDEAPELRILRGVSHTPLARMDGSILDTPGYDDDSGYLYLPTVDVPPVPTNPSELQLRAATTLLRGLIGEFAWAGDHDEANFLGVLLTPLLRQLCPPPYKLIAIMARQPGSGKSLLARIARELHGGVFRSEMPHDDSELSKVITSILNCTTAPVITIDNVTGTLRSGRLDGLLTSATYSDRVLGSTNNIEMANDRLWMLTGNNLSLGGDSVRRSLWVTIDPQVPNPEKRTGFKIDVPTYVAAHRGDLLAALLTWISAWRAEGCPTPPRRSSDDYAQWVSTVNGILTVAGVPGTFDHADSAQQKAGSDDEGWGELLAAIRDVFGETPWLTRDVLAKVHDGRTVDAWGGGADYDRLHPILLDALPIELAEKFLRNGPGGVSRSLGKWLSFRNGRFAGDLVCVSHGSKGRDGQHWMVRLHEKADAA